MNSALRTCLTMMFFGLMLILPGCTPENGDDPSVPVDTDWQILCETSLFNGPIQSLATDGSGNVYVAGESINSNNKLFVARWEKSTNTWEMLGPGNTKFNGGIRAPVVTDKDGNVFACGMVVQNGQNPDWHVVTWSVSEQQWVELSEDDQPSFNNGIYALATDLHGNVIASGDNFDITNNRFVAKWHKSQKSWQKIGNNFTSTVKCLAVDNSGVLYASGSDETGQNASCISRWDGNRWDVVGGIGTNLYGEICSLAVDNNGRIYVGGQFYADANFHNIVWWNSGSWSYMEISNPNHKVNALVTDNAGTLFAGGEILNADNNYFVAKKEASGWVDYGKLNGNGIVYALCMASDGTLYAGGMFTGGQYSHYVAMLKP